AVIEESRLEDVPAHVVSKRDSPDTDGPVVDEGAPADVGWARVEEAEAEIARAKGRKRLRLPGTVSPKEPAFGLLAFEELHLVGKEIEVREAVSLAPKHEDRGGLGCVPKV